MNQYGASLWSAERTETMCKLWAEGFSASQIARQLGRVTRNAVIGKVHRLGLARRITPDRPRPVRTARRPSIAFVPNKVLKPVRVHLPVANLREIRDLEPVCFDDGPRTIETIRPGECHYPIGDPQAPDFAVCGRGTGATYCAQHHRLCYEPTRKRQSQDASIARVTRWLDRRGKSFEAAA